MRVLVIGAGPAGTRAAIRTAAAMPQAQVTLASAEAARSATSKLAMFARRHLAEP